MQKRNICACAMILLVLVIAAECVNASGARNFNLSDLDYEFRDAKKIDLRTNATSSVVTLREVVKIPPPAEPVLLKTFYPNKLSPLMKSAFSDEKIRGVTINGKYIAIMHTDFVKEHQDVIKHELVHAYITLASPQQLPFWFQEGSAVHFSTDRAKKFYGKPSDQIGVMEGKTVEITDTYKQKLQNFHFLLERVGKDKFYEWYKHSVETGVVDARPLLGLDPTKEMQESVSRKPIPVWLWVVISVVVIAVGIIGFYASKRDELYI